MTTQPQSRPEWTEVLDRNRQNVSYALVGVGTALFIAAIVLMWWKGWESAALTVAFLLFGLTSLGCGLWFQAGVTPGLSGKDSARLLALILGGVLGLAVTVGVVWQIVPWWEDVSGGPEVWQKPDKGWHVWLLAGLFLAGLAVMFFSLLLGRGEENENPTLRRLLYGYNAVLTGLLLLGILVALNVLAYIYLPVSSDWTKAGIYTLSSRSENVLEHLKEPVTVYVMETRRGDLFDTQVRDLMENARAVTEKIHAEYVIRDINRDEMQRLKRKYNPDDDRGLIVVYGTGDNAPHTFIPEREVLPPPPFDPMTGRSAQTEPKFKGEDRLVSAITSLEEGKKPVLYFTQGNGELDLFGLDPATAPDRRGQMLLGDLERRGGYEVKGLLLAVPEGKALKDPRVVAANAVPDDAAVVVVAGPTRPLSDAFLEALRTYMREPHKEKDPVNPDKERQRKGKLMVLADVVAGADNRMKPLNLDKLLREYDVDVTNERVLRITDDRRPEVVLVTPNPELKGRNPLATLFERKGIAMSDVRVIRTLAAGRPGEAARFQAVDLLVTAHPVSQGALVIAEPDLRSPAALMKNYLEKNEAELEKRAQLQLPVGVAVSETSAVDPTDPHAAFREREGTPRVEVIGDSTFVSDEGMGGRARREDGGASINYELFASALAWLREKPSSMGLEPKDRGSYAMSENASFVRMMFLPLGLMTLGVVGLGLGVWVVRRR